MKPLYTGFSNYQEFNLDNRIKSVEDEVGCWGQDAEKFKTYRSEWHQSATEDYLPAQPLHVDIELSDACNLRCRMCAHGLGNVQKSGLMGKELAFRLIDECAAIGVCSIKFNWRGEATLNPLLPEAVGYAKKKGILEVQLNTNGQLSKNAIVPACAAQGLDRIIFSVDGFSAETYEQHRIGGKYHKVIDTIKTLLAWKKQHKKNKPFVRIQMVRSTINAHEVEAFIAYWKPLVDDVRISDVMDRGQGDHLAVGDQVTVGRRRCPQPFQRLVIGRDGRVSPCCADWHQDFVAGDVAKESLLAIWNSEKMSMMRTIQRDLRHSAVAICSSCYVKESYIWKKIG